MDENELLADGTGGQGGPGAFHVGAEARGEESGRICGTRQMLALYFKARREGYILCDSIIQGDKNGSKFLDEMRPILSGLQLADDGDDDIIVDAFRVDLGGDGGDRVHGGRGWRVLPSSASGRRTMMLVVAVMVMCELGFWGDGDGVVRPLDFLGWLIIMGFGGDGRRATRGGG